MEKGEIEKKRRKIIKRKAEIENGSRKKFENERTFFFFFFFLLFTFQNDENLFWGYQNGNFLPGKSISHREKNQEKWLCPLRKIFLLRPWKPYKEVYTFRRETTQRIQLAYQISLEVSIFWACTTFKIGCPVTGQPHNYFLELPCQLPDTPFSHMVQLQSAINCGAELQSKQNSETKFIRTLWASVKPTCQHKIIMTYYATS